MHSKNFTGTSVDGSIVKLTQTTVDEPIAVSRAISSRTTLEGPREMEVEALEPRILFSGSPVSEPAPAPDPAPVAQEAVSSVASAEEEIPVVEVEAQTQSETEAVQTLELGAETVAAMAEVAAGIWQTTGLTTEQTAALANASYVIADLGGNFLGAMEGATITIDDDAAGRGWFIDQTPEEGSEFENGDSIAKTSIDLLSVMLHEQGHLLGLLDKSDEEGDVMLGYIGTGERRLPVAGAADGAIAGSLEGIHHIAVIEEFDGETNGATEFENGLFSLTGSLAVVTGQPFLGADNSAEFVDSGLTAAPTTVGSIQIQTGSFVVESLEAWTGDLGGIRAEEGNVIFRGTLAGGGTVEETVEINSLSGYETVTFNGALKDAVLTELTFILDDVNIQYLAIDNFEYDTSTEGGGGGGGEGGGGSGGNTLDAINDDYTVSDPIDENTVLNIPAAGVLVNDGGSGEVTQFDATSASGATVNVNSDGSFSYDPTGSPTIQALNNGEFINDTFTYTIFEDGETDKATVTVRVNGIGTPDGGGGGGVPGTGVIESVQAGVWTDPATWGGEAPVAGKTYRAVHDLTGSNVKFEGDELIIADSGSLRRTNSDGSETWTLNNLRIEAGGDVLGGSSNRKNTFLGDTITLENGAELSGLGRNALKLNFDKWVSESSATVFVDSFNNALELGDGPGPGPTDFSGFEGTFLIQNRQGLNRADLLIPQDIPVGTIQLQIQDRDLEANNTSLPTLYEIRNGFTQYFSSVNVHQVRLTTDIDGDNKYDPGDGDVITVQDLTLPPGLYTKADLDALGAIGDSFLDQGAGTGMIGVVAAGGENNAPVLASGVENFEAVQVSDTDNIGNSVTFLTNGQISDPDIGAAVGGIAVTETSIATRTGKFQFNRESGWVDINQVSDSNALLLLPTDRLRFVPDGVNTGEDLASITFRAWDQTDPTSGLKGTYVDVSTNGGTSPFSAETQTVSIEVIRDLVGTVIDSVQAGSWTDPATWGGQAPVAGNTYRALHELSGSNVKFEGDELIITNTGGLRRTNGDGSSNWDLNNLTIEEGGRVLFGSSNRNNFINGDTIRLEDGALIKGVGRSNFKFNFDTWIVDSTATVLADSTNTIIEFGDGPGSGPSDFSQFAGTLQLTNTQGRDKADLLISVGIPESDGAIQLKIQDRDLSENGTNLTTLFELRNGITTYFASVEVHQVRLTTDIDGDNRYDPGDGDEITVQDLTLPPGMYTKADLDALGAIGDSFRDQGAGTGIIAIGGVVPLDAVDDNYSVSNPITEDQVLTIPEGAGDLLANDAPSNTAEIIGINGTMSLTGTSASGAAVNVSSSGSFSYDPTNVQAIQELDGGDSLVDTFTYTIRDDSAVEATETATVTITVNGLNDAPMLAGANDFTEIMVSESDNNGDLVSDLVGTITDVDDSAVIGGIAIIDETGPGAFEYSTDGGVNWSAVNASAANALLLTGNTDTRLRFVPDGTDTTEGTLTFRAWDQTIGVAGGRTDLSSSASVGGITAFSAEEATSTVMVIEDESDVFTYTADPGQANRFQISVIDSHLVIKDLNGHTLNGGDGSNMIMVPIEDFTDIEIDTGDEDDIIRIGDMGAFAGNFKIVGGEGFDIIDYTDNDLVLDAGKNAEFEADVINILARASLKTSSDGAINLVADKNVKANAGSMLQAGSGGITIRANDGEVGVSGNFAGIDLRAANLSTTDGGDIVLDGVGGDTRAANRGVYLWRTNIDSSGAIDIDGSSNGGTNYNNGVSIVGGTVNATEDVDIDGRGSTSNAGSGNLNAGVSADYSSVISSDASISIVGTAGNGDSNNAGVNINRSVSIEAGTDLTIIGSGAGDRSGNRGVYLANRVNLEAQTGAINITGTATQDPNANGTFNVGVELLRVSANAATTATINGLGGFGSHYSSGVALKTVTLDAGGDIAVTGTGGDATGNSNHGLFIALLSNIDSSGGTVNLAGNATNGAHFNSGVSILQRSVVNGNGVNIIGNGAGTGSQNAGIKVWSSMIDARSGALNMTGAGSADGLGAGNNGVDIRSTSLMGSSASQILGTKGGGTRSVGASMYGISGNLSASNVMTNPDEDDEKVGNFFNYLPIIPMLLAEGSRRTNDLSASKRWARRKEIQNNLSDLFSQLSWFANEQPSKTMVVRCVEDHLMLNPIHVDTLLVYEILGTPCPSEVRIHRRIVVLMGDDHDDVSGFSAVINESGELISAVPLQAQGNRNTGETMRFLTTVTTGGEVQVRKQCFKLASGNSQFTDLASLYSVFGIE